MRHADLVNYIFSKRLGLYRPYTPRNIFAYQTYLNVSLDDILSNTDLTPVSSVAPTDPSGSSKQPSSKGPGSAGDDKSLETMVGGIAVQFPSPPRRTK